MFEICVPGTYFVAHIAVADHHQTEHGGSVDRSSGCETLTKPYCCCGQQGSTCYAVSAHTLEQLKWFVLRCRFAVVGSTGRHYNVDLASQGHTCQCPDFRMRKRACKHIKLVLQQLSLSDSHDWHEVRTLAAIATLCTELQLDVRSARDAVPVAHSSPLLSLNGAGRQFCLI